MKKLFLYTVSILLITTLLLSSCNKQEEGTTSYLQAYNLTEIQTEIVESIVSKKADDITKEDLDSVTKIIVAGKNADSYTSSTPLTECSSVDYKYAGKTYEYKDGYGNELSVLGLFESLEKLEILYAPSLTDASFLSDLQKLTSLSITMTNIRDLTILDDLTELISVDIWNTPVEKIKFNPGNKIESFYMMGSLITDASAFGALNKDIKQLSVLFNKKPMENLEAFCGFTKLTHFGIMSPELSLAFLSELDADIEIIHTGGTDNIDLSKIVKYKDTLTDLHIHDCSGIDLTPLDELNKIKQITLYNVKNPIRGTKTEPDSGITFDLNFNWNLYSWFEYEE